jgi:phytoene synthase
MSRFSVEPAEFIHRRHSDRFEKLIQFQIDYIESCFAKALSAFPPVDRASQRPLLVLAAISRALLREIRADGCHVLERRTSLTPLRKLWISLRSPESV